MFKVSTFVSQSMLPLVIIIIIIIIIIITVFIVRGLQDWPMAHYNCSYGMEMHVKNREK